MKQQENKRPNYIFPDFLGEWMSNISQQVQYEASMLSMTLLMVGLILSGVYAVLYLPVPLWFKITTCINCLFGIVFMWSFIVTTYQQYLAYMDSVKLQEILNTPKSSLPSIGKINTMINTQNKLKGGKTNATKKNWG